jgi:hypothetical protein
VAEADDQEVPAEQIVKATTKALKELGFFLLCHEAGEKGSGWQASRWKAGRGWFRRRG